MDSKAKLELEIQGAQLKWLEETLAANGEPLRLPPRLYKYLSPDSRYFALALHELLLHNRIRLSARAEFNDPFDASTVLQYVDDDTVQSWFSGVLTPHGLDHLRAPLLAHAKADSVSFQRKSYETLKGTFDRLGIYSLSAVPDNPLMWAHYATSHRGVVVGFDHLTPTFIAAVPVRYQQELPAFSLNPDVQLHLLAAVKGLPWSYEREWRLINPNQAREWIAIEPSSILSICLGARCSAEDRQAVRELLSRRALEGLPDVELYEVELSEDSFEMRFKRLELPHESADLTTGVQVRHPFSYPYKSLWRQSPR